MTPVLMSGIGLVAIGLGILTFLLARAQAVDPPTLGHRGLMRQRALAEGGLFRAAEPLLRKMAAWFSRIPMAAQRATMEGQIALAGEWLGLRPDELLAMSLLGAIGAGAVAAFVVNALEASPLLILVAAAIGGIVPQTRISAQAKDRGMKITRGLPPAIDLAALCMGAGLDFPGALRQIVSKSPQRTDPLVVELERILQEFEVGRTRAQALRSFADRVPSDAVKDFVTAVVQSEEKGTPLAEILRVQASMLRTHRTVRAEVSAARAAVVMLLPLMLVFASVILLLMGPFAIKGLGSGL